MSDSDALYAELKPDIEALAAPLFDVSEFFVRQRGGFLPHGAVLVANGDTRMVMAAPPGFEDHAVSPLEILPMLHEGLRVAARVEILRAIAVCDDVTIVPEGEKKRPRSRFWWSGPPSCIRALLFLHSSQLQSFHWLGLRQSRSPARFVKGRCQ